MTVDSEQPAQGTPSPNALREDLIDAVEKELLGPARGPEEEIVFHPTDRYLVGRLAPQGILEASEQDDLGVAGDISNDDGEVESGRSGVDTLMPSSIGMTFAVDGSTEAVRVSASWGQYLRAESATLETEAGNPKAVWKRHQAGGEWGLQLNEPDLPHQPDPDRDDVKVEGRVRRSPDGNWVVTLFLVNGQPMPDASKDEAWLFQPELVVMAPDGAPIFRQRPIVAAGESGGLFSTQEQRGLEMGYRHEVEFVVGHGVSVYVERGQAASDRAVEIGTAVMPRYDVPMTESPTLDDYSERYPAFANLVLDMKLLSELDGAALTNALSGLAESYRAWIEQSAARVETPSPDLEPHAEAARQSQEKWELALKRIDEGILALASDPDAQFAFKFANRAMWLQRTRSEYVRRRRHQPDIDMAEIDVPENRSWYPFQLAFFLIVLPTVTDPKHEARVDPVRAIADLLWYPTGGGKTEAYLGIAAYTMVLRRLQGEQGGRDGMSGVAVIMRYTLRLLTIQQFQRAAVLMCALEVLRREAHDSGDTRIGGVPFRIGLWVGRRATPNTTDDSHDAVRDARDDAWNGGYGSGTPAQLAGCPWCGQEIRIGRDLKVDPGVRRTYTFCSDKLGHCPFSRRQAPDEGLPVLVVDEEIYRLLPALLIATVDKFAQMPWKGEVQALFGRVNKICERHGFLTPESKCSGRHPRRGNRPPVQPVDTPLLRPPDLIIQDELHLISGPLGSLAGLYETAVDELCSWELEGIKIRPKVIASTATIRNARQQVHSLFLRQVEVFPPNGLDAGDNFFAIRQELSEDSPGRAFLGICAPGRDRITVLIRVYVALLCAAQDLYEHQGTAADPWMTLTGYFNSIKELGGMRRLVEDDVKTRAFRIERGDDYRPGLAQRQVNVIEELTSRRSSTDIPEVLERLESAFDPDRDEGAPRPIDVLLATNMISVGVDVRRLGLMVVNGQPKTVAEYIQATSRVGRASPGLICAVMNWARPRDMSHYETFEHFHATYYRQVEALSLTPFASRAVQRGLTGVLTALVRLDDFEYNANEAAGKFWRADPKLETFVDAIKTRGWNVTDQATVSDDLQQMMHSRLDFWAHEAEVPNRTLGYKGRRDGSTVGLLRSPGGRPWDEFTTLNSLRDVEPSVPLLLEAGSSDQDLPSWQPPPAESEDQG